MEELRQELLTGIFGDEVPDIVSERRRRGAGNLNMTLLSNPISYANLWRSAEQQLDDIEEEYEADQDIVLGGNIDIAGSLRKERTRMCHGNHHCNFTIPTRPTLSPT